MQRDKDEERKERLATDEGLRDERTKTDTELARARAAIEHDSDDVLDAARDRAERVLDAARERNDAELESAGASEEIRERVQAERSIEDRSLADERAAADQRLQVERDERARALSALLALERETTDDRLREEREYADRVVNTRDDFLGMVSHDVRSLLGTIALTTAVISREASVRGEAGAGTQQHAARIQRATARMNRLIGDLLDVVSIEAGRLDVSPQRRDATQLVREAVEAFQLIMAAKGVRLTTSIARGALLAKFDHERVLQVLANLLSNALKFTPSGGEVALRIAPFGSLVRFSVVDTGIGIPADEHEVIFERFHQVGHRDRRGLGLGLYIAKCIVEAHGGRIWAETPEHGGAAIHFTLPCADEEPQRELPA